MKKTLLSSAIAAVVIATVFAWACFTSSQASAQGPIVSGVQGPGGIALVDVNYILRKHVRLHAQLTDLKVEMDKVRKDFEQRGQHFQEEAQQLSQMKPGTPDYQRLEEQMVSEKANVQGQIALKNKEFEQKEAHLYYNAYLEISEEVRAFCEQRGISLVLNFNGDNIHEENPADISRGIANKVVFFNKNLDITPYVKQRFERPITANPVGPMFPTQR
ncbi:MAG: OmpH family outer membrane protein [Thermoguttaceae bacterium]